MTKANTQGHGDGFYPDAQYKVVDVFLRLADADRRKVLHLFNQLAYGKAGTTSSWVRWSKDDIRSCYRRLLPISQEMAIGWARWATGFLEVGHNTRWAIKCLVDELVFRMWIEEPGIDS